MPMDEFRGKTAEQIAFKGIASAITPGRNKAGASSSAACTVAAVITITNAMITGRKERIFNWHLECKQETDHSRGDPRTRNAED